MTDPTVHGEYNACEYRVWLTVDSEKTLLYHAGNSLHCSQTWVPAEDGVEIEQMREFCEATTIMFAMDETAEFIGAYPLED